MMKDLNNDGIVNQAEVELNLKIDKSDTQKNMAWTALVSMIIFAAILFIQPETKLKALSELLGTLFLAQAGIVGAYMGFTTWLNRK